MLPALATSRMGLWGPVVAYMAMLFGFSSLSSVPTPPAGFSFYDAHIAAYAGLGLVTTRALAGGLSDVRWLAVCGGILMAALYGVSDEYHQTFVPGRSFDRFDILADVVGSIVGAIGAGAWSIIRRRL